jgi:hypothetical protein
MKTRIFFLSIATLMLVGTFPERGAALPVAPLNTVQVDNADQLILVAKRHHGGGKRAHVVHGSRGHGNRNQAYRYRNYNHAYRYGNYNRYRYGGNYTSYRYGGGYTRSVGPVVYVRPYRQWVERPYYGAIIGGVTLGTIIAVSTPRTVPDAPAENTCWFWADEEQAKGYWDYCAASSASPSRM